MSEKKLYRLQPFARAVEGILHCDEKEWDLLLLLLRSLVVDPEEFKRIQRANVESSSV